MSYANKLSFALLVGLSAAAFTSIAAAQDSAARDAAIAKCTKLAHTQYPGDTTDNQNARVSVYKDCMRAAGFNP